MIPNDTRKPKRLELTADATHDSTRRAERGHPHLIVGRRTLRVGFDGTKQRNHYGSQQIENTDHLVAPSQSRRNM